MGRLFGSKKSSSKEQEEGNAKSKSSAKPGKGNKENTNPELANEAVKGRNKGGKDSNGQEATSSTTPAATSKLNNKRMLRDKAKQKSENNRSLRKIKKRDVVRQMLQGFPKESKAKKKASSASYNVSGANDDEEDKIDYASRKLLIRQMQGMIAKEAHVDEGGSEYDSWSDLEENFARAYEPIPLDIDLATWRSMTKRDIIDTVRSRQMKKDFEYMSRSEILAKIEKMQQSARYLSEKFGVDHLLDKSDHHVKVQVHRSNTSSSSSRDSVSVGTDFSNNLPEYLSRSEILKVYDAKRSKTTAEQSEHKRSREHLNERHRKSHHDSWSSRASSILNNPESIYVSREEVLKNLHHSKPTLLPAHAAISAPAIPAKVKKKPQQVTDPKTRPTKHDSWSSHASSILANQASNMKSEKEPHYMSRAELLDKLADLAQDNNTLSYRSTCSGSSDSSSCCSDSDVSCSSDDSEASTVKNVVLKARHEVHTSDNRRKTPPVINPLPVPPHVSKDDSRKLLQPSVKEAVSVKTSSNSSEANNKANSSSSKSPLLNGNFFKGFVKKPINNKQSAADHHQLMSRTEMVERMKPRSDSERGLSSANGEEDSTYSFTSECDTCSCTSCETYSDCSCCGGEDDDEDIYSYTSSDCSTVVEGDSNNVLSGRDKGNNVVDAYVANGSHASSKQSSSKTVEKSNQSHDDDNSVLGRSKTKQKLQQSKSGGTSISEQNAVAVDSSRRKRDVSVPEYKEVIKTSAPAEQSKSSSVWKNDESNPIYEPVNAREIQRQKNARAMKKHLRELASDWDTRINDLNTLRRGHVLKELKRFLREKIDFDNVQPEEINRQVEVLLRQALDSNFEALSNRNIGHMYIPEEVIPSHSKMVSSRENTDYDTFGSIDSLIFEPKIGSKKYIRDAQAAIEKQFQYLNNEDGGEDSQDDLLLSNYAGRSRQLRQQQQQARQNHKIAGPGKTTFAERVRLFQNLAKNPMKPAAELPPPQRPVKKITFLDVSGQETSWKELANNKKGNIDVSSSKHKKSHDKHVSISTKVHVDSKRKYSEQLDDPEQEVSLCPECNNPIDASMTTCSICDCCTQCALNDNEEDEEPVTNNANTVSYNMISASNSWNYLNSGRTRGEESSTDSSLSGDSVNKVAERTSPKEEATKNLRRQLKEAFGATSSAGNSPDNDEPERNNRTIVDVIIHRDADEDINATPSFLVEYATRRSLSEEVTESAVLVREGGTVQLTEEMFRGGLKGTLRKIARGEESVESDHKKQLLQHHQQGSEMGDSGIASPPASQCFVPSSVARSSPGTDDVIKEAHDDSGVEEAPVLMAEKRIALPGMKKRDTMIRELKSKLKEKFQQVESTSSSESNSISNHQSEEQTLPSGTVVSRRETVGPKLSKLFGNVMLKQQQQLVLAASIPTAQMQNIPVPVLPTSKVLNLNKAPSNASSNMSASTSSSKLSATTSSSEALSKKLPTTTTFKSIYENKACDQSVVSSNSTKIAKENFSSESESTVYDPSLPDELKKSVPAGIMFRGNRPFTPPIANNVVQASQVKTKKKVVVNTSKSKASSTCSGCGGKKCSALNDEVTAQHLAAANPADRREFLYGPGGIFGPKGPFSTPMVRYPHGLELPPSNSSANPAGNKRSVTFKTPNTHNPMSLSDCSSAVEDRSVKSHYVINSMITAEENNTGGSSSKPPASRMETYRAEWAEQECLPSRPSKPLVPEDLERWREEKARRMLAWINSSQLTGYWGSETPWWKVGEEAAECQQSFFDSLNVPNNTPATTVDDGAASSSSVVEGLEKEAIAICMCDIITC